MTGLPVQARHGPDDTMVDGTEATCDLLAVAANADPTRLTPRGLQIWPKSSTVTTAANGHQRQAVIVRCPCGHDHQHFAPVGVPFVIRRAPCRLRYAIHLEFLW